MGKMKKFHFRLIMTVIERNRMCIKYIFRKKDFNKIWNGITKFKMG
jgi:hypothetical protein